MSDAFDPNIQPPPNPNPPQPTVAPPELNPFNPFPQSPQDPRFWNLTQNIPTSQPQDIGDSPDFLEKQQQIAALEPTVVPPQKPPAPAPQPPAQPPAATPTPTPTPPAAQGKPPPKTPPQWVPHRRQFYNPNLPNRGPDGWGMARQFPMLPLPWQIPDVLMGVGRDFSMVGAPLLALLGGALGRYVKAFMDGLHKGQREWAKQHKEHAKRTSRDLDKRTQGMLDEYRNAFAQSSGPEDQQNLEENIRAIATKYNDQKMLNSLNNNGISGVIQMLNWIDAKHGDLKAANQADDEHGAQLTAQNPFVTNPVDSLGMPVTRQPLPFATTPTRLAGELPTPDTSDEDTSDPYDPDSAEGQGKEERGELPPPRTGPDPNLDRDPGPVTREEQNNPAAGGGFHHLPFDPSSSPISPHADPYDPQRRPTTGDKPVPIPPSKDPAQTYPPGTRTLAQPIQTAQADTGTATDAPSPAETATEDQEPQAGDPFTHAMTRAGLKAAVALPGYGVRSEDPAVAAEARKQQALRERERQIAEDEAKDPPPDTPAMRGIKNRDPKYLKNIDGLAKRKFFGQISASEWKELVKAGMADDINSREIEMERGVDDILGRAQSGELKPEQVMAEIRKNLGARVAGETQSILDGLGSSRANLKTTPYNFLIPLAKAVDPTMTDASLKARISTMTYWTGRTGTQIISRGVHAMEVGADLRSTLANQPNYFRIKAYQALRAGNARAAAEAFPDVAQWFGALEAGKTTFSNEANYVFNAGNATMSEREAMRESIDWNDPQRAMQIIDRQMAYLKWRMEDNRRLFKAGMGTAPNADAIFKQMLGPIGEKWGGIKEGAGNLDELERNYGGGGGQQGGGGGGKVHSYEEYFK